MEPEKQKEVTKKRLTIAAVVFSVFAIVWSAIFVVFYWSRTYKVVGEPPKNSEISSEHTDRIQQRIFEREALEEYYLRRIDEPEEAEVEEPSEFDEPEFNTVFDLSQYEEALAEDEPPQVDEENADLDAESAYRLPVTLTVPGDFPTLDEALAELGYRGTRAKLVLKRAEKPYQLDARKFSPRAELTIVGETGDAEDVCVEAAPGTALTLDAHAGSKLVFEGLTLADLALFVVVGELEARDCVFKSSRGSGNVGVELSGPGTSLRSLRCEWSGQSVGIVVGARASASVYGCEFGAKVESAIVTREDARVDVEETRFASRKSALYLGSGTTGTVRNCRFENKKARWTLEDPPERSGVAFWNNEE